jgi:hypothetical protein
MARIEGAARDHSIPEGGQDTLPQGRSTECQKKKKESPGTELNEMQLAFRQDEKSHTKAQHIHESDMLFAMMNDETSFLGTPSSPRTITKRILGPINPHLEYINGTSYCLQILSSLCKITSRLHST